MTKEKWKQECSKNYNIYYAKVYNEDPIGPENWHKYKAAFLEYSKDMDELTEIYNMENK